MITVVNTTTSPASATMLLWGDDGSALNLPIVPMLIGVPSASSRANKFLVEFLGGHVMDNPDSSPLAIGKGLRTGMLRS